MQITDYVHGVKITVGEPSKNHLKIELKTNNSDVLTKIEMGYPQWLDLKAKIDKMFKAIENF